VARAALVLIDGDSASASEISPERFAIIHRGTIIGERSYGKGSVQESSADDLRRRPAAHDGQVLFSQRQADQPRWRRPRHGGPQRRQADRRRGKHGRQDVVIAAAIQARSAKPRKKSGGGIN